MVAAGIVLCTLWALALFGPGIRVREERNAHHEGANDADRIPWGLIFVGLIASALLHAHRAKRERDDD